MKAKLEFDLTEENYDFKLATNAKILHSVLYDLVNHKLRNEIKHGDHSEEKLNAYEDIRDYIVDYLDGEGLNFFYFEE